MKNAIAALILISSYSAFAQKVTRAEINEMKKECRLDCNEYVNELKIKLNSLDSQTQKQFSSILKNERKACLSMCSDIDGEMNLYQSQKQDQ